MDLQEIRKELDVIDRQIVDLYEKRMKLCGDVAEYKISVGKPVYDGEREKQKLEAVRQICQGPVRHPAKWQEDAGTEAAEGGEAKEKQEKRQEEYSG